MHCFHMVDQAQYSGCKPARVRSFRVQDMRVPAQDMRVPAQDMWVPAQESGQRWIPVQDLGDKSLILKQLFWNATKPCVPGRSCSIKDVQAWCATQLRVMINWLYKITTLMGFESALIPGYEESCMPWQSNAAQQRPSCRQSFCWWFQRSFYSSLQTLLSKT